MTAMPRSARPSAASIAAPFARHLVLFLLSMAAGAALAIAAPAHEQPVLWVVAGAIAGLLAGVLARGVAGPIVVATGFVVGVGVGLQATTDGHWPIEELRSGAPTLGLALAAALVAYVAVRLILTRRR
jgi:hypothetical protein